MATAPPLRVLSDVRSVNIAGLPVLTAYGDSDDHLRLTVLMADTLKTRGAGVGLAALAQTCMARDIPWEVRHDALWEMVRVATPAHASTYFGVLVDPDALELGPLEPDTELNDREFRRQRSKFRELVERVVKRNGWIVVRPQPSPEVELPSSEPTLLTPPVPDLAQLFEKISPDIRPVLSWLVRSGNLAWRDVERRFEHVNGDLELLERRLVSMAYNALPERAATAAERLSIVRHTLALDGDPGPYLLVADPAMAIPTDIMAEETSIDRESLEFLRSAGLLQSWPLLDGREALRMPRTIRTFLLQQAGTALPPWVGREHRRLSTPQMERDALDSRLEVHYHAIRVHPADQADIDRAFATAHYYAADLREMAFRLSFVEKRWEDAARVYRRIVEIDRTDAYAWEYLGYNLARADRDDPGVREQIFEAYENAIAYDTNSDNPLYHGRLLGFRARLGEDVGSEFEQRMRRYRGSDAAVTYFAEAVLRGVSSSAKRKALIDPWRSFLARNERLARFLGEAA